MRPFGCGVFIREFLSGQGPYGSTFIDPAVGAPQADIFYQYKIALLKATAMDRAVRYEEKRARKEARAIDPDNIENLAERYLSRLPYKGSSCRYHSFITYFSNLKKLGWVEATGREEQSEFQEHYGRGQPRRFYRLTILGKASSDAAWANPQTALYG